MRSITAAVCHEFGAPLELETVNLRAPLFMTQALVPLLACRSSRGQSVLRTLALFCAGVAQAADSEDDLVILTLQPGEKRQMIEGFGASGAWWAQ